MTEDRLLTVREVAEIFRVSTMTVYRLLEEGELCGLRIGSSWRIRTSKVESYLRAQAEIRG